MDNIKRIDSLINKLSTSKLHIENLVKENEDDEPLKIINTKISIKNSILYKKSINSLLKKYGYSIQDDNIFDKNGNIFNINSFRKIFLNTIKNKLLKYKSLNDGEIKNKKDRYYAFLTGINTIIRNKYNRDIYKKDESINDSIIKKGMGNF